MPPFSDSPAPPTDPTRSAAPEAPAALVAALLARNTQQQELIEVLQTRIAELERRLGLNSGNSGKPPSSDGLKKPRRTQSLRIASGKKSGGQKGHPGKTLRQVEKPDATIDHFPQTCGGCGAALEDPASLGFGARQIFDIPQPRPLEVTEHRAHVCRCMACGERTRAAYPAGVAAPVQYGERLDDDYKEFILVVSHQKWPKRYSGTFNIFIHFLIPNL